MHNLRQLMQKSVPVASMAFAIPVDNSLSETIRIFNGLEKGTCAPNNHEQAFLQKEETED